MIRSYYIAFLSLFLLLGACQDPQTASAPIEDTVVIKAITVKETRDSVSKKPVATHTEKVPDELNDWKFSVQVFETEQTFQYTVRIQFKELRVTESITLPNLGTLPQPQIQADPDTYSCTIGFLDKKEQFKPYYRAKVVNNKLQFKKIAAYAVGVTSTPVK